MIVMLIQMNRENEEIAILIVNNKNLVVNDEIVVNAIIIHFDVCLEVLLNHRDFELDVSYQKGKSLYNVSEKRTSKSIKIIIQKYKNKININEIKNTKVTPEKDAQIQ